MIESTRGYSRELIRGVAQFNREQSRWRIEYTPGSIRDLPSQWLKEWNGDGILARIETKPMLNALLRKKVPVIDLRRSFSHPDIPSIGPDDRCVIQMLFEHFRRAGFTRFAFVSTVRNYHAAMDLRRDTCRELVHANKLTFSDIEIEPPDSGGDKVRMMKKLSGWLKRLAYRTAVIACTDDFALQVLNGCRLIERNVPNDIAVAGIGNDDCLCELALPTLTSVDLAPKKIGYNAAELLQKMMDENYVPPKTILFQPSMIVSRMSTDTIATEDVVVSEALRFIHVNVCGGVQVKDVLRHVHLSRVALENRFKKAIGHTIFQEILDVRLRKVRELLTTTDLPFKTVAFQTGFDYPEYLMRLFREKYGQTMKVFRKNHGMK
ncbi:MAG: XylR family transcriptional regulator [Planctomycetaceae bacterium]|nr:XylR family transcriptional regulator [Planctomycetaceae bacterium]